MKRSAAVAGTTLLVLTHLTSTADAVLVGSDSTPTKVAVDAATVLVPVDSSASSIAGGRGTVSDGAVGIPLDTAISFP